MADLFYVDDNSREGKHCGSGGANVPALNSLLAPLGVAFGSRVFSGAYSLGGRLVDHLSGASIASFPARGLLHYANLRHATRAALGSAQGMQSANRSQVPVLGVLSLPGRAEGRSGGFLVAMGDSCSSAARTRRP